MQQLFVTIIEQAIAEHGMRLPIIVCNVANNGSVLVTRINEGAEPDTLAQHYENNAFALPINVMLVSQNNKAVRVVIEREGKVGRFH
ncbi:hypothetical protein [Bradyrhizobium sp. Mp27]|uniref:hypothetical protein n=1 Tax=Bradyrhizobium sp. Mp27 TaxID=3042157 RepID=UPI00248B93A9|nr:hypothetical protein [Bradyrhizobium sp. Mp27]MDI2075361.1 hypothetical protein [Bradyrhizobium sp. Mp27]